MRKLFTSFTTVLTHCYLLHLQHCSCFRDVVSDQIIGLHCIEVSSYDCVGFVAAAVSMPIGGCRARRSLVVDVDVSVATELTVL